MWGKGDNSNNKFIKYTKHNLYLQCLALRNFSRFIQLANMLARKILTLHKKANIYSNVILAQCKCKKAKSKDRLLSTDY